MSPKRYCGRFAPTPSGGLHFGSLVTALGSFLEAKKAGGRWLVRIEDGDILRCDVGAIDRIFRSLDSLGLHWDDEVVFQSRRLDLYQVFFDKLKDTGLIYPCTCSRKSMSSQSILGVDGAPLYSGACRSIFVVSPPTRQCSYRLNVESAGNISFVDAIQGNIVQNLASAVGDFVVLRADGVFAYHFAVVVDDYDAGVSDIVRGSDLVDSTPRQIFLQRLLGFPTPSYCHLPIAINSSGEKLSKQAKSLELRPADASRDLVRALQFLGQNPSSDLVTLKSSEIIEWAIQNWNLPMVPRQRQLLEI